MIGCGALKFLDREHGEFKSIRIHDNFRNQGQGINVINHLINEAKKLKIKRLSIETGAGDFFIPARNIYEMMNINVPIICIVIGEGASGGALGIGVGDKILMLENTWYSVISPESCSSILWRSCCLLYTSPSPRDLSTSRMPSSA